MKKEDYIQPTKDAPVFKCHNDYWGYIEDSMYKDWEIHKENMWSVGSTFAIDLTNAILKLHNYIKENKETIAPKSKFSILMINGSLNRKGEINEKKCYSISHGTSKTIQTNLKGISIRGWSKCHPYLHYTPFFILYP